MEFNEANHVEPTIEIIRHYRSNRTQNSTLNERSMFLATAKCTAKAAWKYSGTDFFTMCSNTTPNHMKQARRLANNIQTACLPPSIWLCKQIQLMYNIYKLKFEFINVIHQLYLFAKPYRWRQTGSLNVISKPSSLLHVIWSRVTTHCEKISSWIFSRCFCSTFCSGQEHASLIEGAVLGPIRAVVSYYLDSGFNVVRLIELHST